MSTVGARVPTLRAEKRQVFGPFKATFEGDLIKEAGIDLLCVKCDLSLPAAQKPRHRLAAGECSAEMASRGRHLLCSKCWLKSQ